VWGENVVWGEKLDNVVWGETLGVGALQAQ